MDNCLHTLPRFRAQVIIRHKYYIRNIILLEFEGYSLVEITKLIIDDMSLLHIISKTKTALCHYLSSILILEIKNLVCAFEILKLRYVGNC